MSDYRPRGRGGFHRGGHRGGFHHHRGGFGGMDDNRYDRMNDDRNEHRNDNRNDNYGSSNSQQQDSGPVQTQVVQHKLSLAVICASNQNRSMSAHYLLSKKYGMAVSSFGTGSSVKLPGKTRDTPNIYDFGTPYQRMFEDLKQQDEEL